MRSSRLVTWGAAVVVAVAALSCSSNDASPPLETTASITVPGPAPAPATTPAPSPAPSPGRTSIAGSTSAGVPTTGGAPASAGPSSSASSTSAASSPTTRANGSCPGPDCTDYSIAPQSGPAGTSIEVRAVSGACTVTETLALLPSSPSGPSIASGTLAARGASQYGGAITVPTGTAPGTYVVSSRSPSTAAGAGACEASFTVTN